MYDAKPLKAGYFSSFLMVALTIIAYGTAMCTPPISGPFAAIQGTTYPYTDVLSRFPRDYLWMYAAILLMFIYIFFMTVIDQYTHEGKKIYSRVSLIFAYMSAVILIVNYFLQVSVIQASLLKGEYDGIAMLTQYNPHGIFIAAEEIGYICMAISILFLAPVFNERNRIHRNIRWTAILCFGLTVISFGLISVVYGVMREYFFECAVMTINWTALILIGIFAGILFRRGGTIDNER